MPEAIINSTDYIIYKFIKNLPKSYCFIHPNMITLFRAILLLPIIDNIKNNESILIGTLLPVVYMILDIFDGAQARKCNTSSKLGAILDELFDQSWRYVILIYCIIKIFKIKKKIYIKKNKNKIVLNRDYIVIILFILALLIDRVISTKSTQFKFFFHFIGNSIFYNNTIISTFIFMLVLKLLLNNYTKTIKEIDEDK